MDGEPSFFIGKLLAKELVNIMANKKSEEFRRQVADMFIEGLRKDGLAWKQGWKSESILPTNAKSGIPYRGMNRINLFYTALSRGYEDTRWLTFNQIKDAGYALEKGSKGAKVEYWYPFDRLERKPLTWKKYNMLIKDGIDKERFAIFVKMYTVFNGDNIKGLPEKEEYINPDITPGELIEKLSKSMEVPIIHDINHEACYIPSRDEIFLPPVEKFLNAEAYNATALHELAHSTGHESRLDREMANAFGSEGYSFEELVAEMTSVFMSVHTEIDPMNTDIENHQAYVNGWIEAIEKSPEVLSKAIKYAEEATAYMEEKAGISEELLKEAEKIKAFEFEYRMLGRLQQDCEYYLGAGGKDAEHALYYHDEKRHIEEMKNLYDKVPIKPEWLSEEKLKEYEKLLLNTNGDILQEFNDKFYKFGVVLTSENEVRALTHDEGWITWFDKEGKCMGNTDQLNIWLSDRGNSDYPDSEQFLMPTCEDVLEMVESIAKVYGITIPEAQLGNVIDLEDFGELSFNATNLKADFLKDAEENLHEESPVERLKDMFNSKEKEIEAEGNTSSKVRHKALELEL